MNTSYSKMILIVDSSRHSAQTTARLLQTWGYSTEVAHSSAAALKMLNQGEVFPDMIFVEMPHPSGAIFNFPSEVHSNPLWRSVPLMARGPGGEKQNIVRAIDSGYCDYIVRPMESDILQEKIEKSLRRSLRIDAATFSVPINVTATAELSIDLTGLSEFGVEGYCNHRFPPDAILCLKSEFLKQFDLEQCNFRVVGCEESRTEAGKYKIALTFIGLRARSANLIRKFSLGQSRKMLMTA